jgi:phosphatidylinositol alpha 1,6-mannosyltransferase
MPNAVYLGARTGAQLARVYASLDVFAHPGPYETFGQTLQEAQASGLPVVAPAIGGPVDLVDDGRNGCLVRPHDAMAIRDAVASLAADPAKRAEFGRTARAAVAGRTWSAVADELVGHYRSVLGAERPIGSRHVATR